MEKLDVIALEVNTTCTDIAHSCLEPIHSLTASATQCPILSARVILKCWKHSRIGLSWAVRQDGEEGVFRADIVAVGNSSSRRRTDNLKQLHGSSQLQNIVYSQAGAHHVTATNGLESLRPCSLSDVTVEGSRLSGSFRRFHLRIWPADQGWDHLS